MKPFTRIIIRILYVYFCLAMAFQGCKPIGPEDIRYGKEDCHFCKMRIVDNRFASEIVNTKRKAFKFDDLYCLKEFLKSGEIADNEIYEIYVCNYASPGKLLVAKSSYFLYAKALKSPMGGNYAAFNTEGEREMKSSIPDAKMLSWPVVLEYK